MKSVINGDGKKEILAGCSDRHVYVFGEGGEFIWRSACQWGPPTCLEANMSHTRVRIGNTKGFGTSQAVVAGDQVFLLGCTGLSLDGKGFVGKGDPAAQAENALRNVRLLLEEVGARMEDICLINNFTTERSYRAQVYPVIARHLDGVNPVSTGVIVKALAEPYINFEIDVWAVIPRDRQQGHQRFRLTNAKGGYLMPNLDYGNARIIRANDHLFLQGQTGMSLDGRSFTGEGDPEKQAEVAMQNVRELLSDAGAGIEDVCKVTTYMTDPSYRANIYPVLAQHLQHVHPVCTNTIVKGLARPELDFEIDVFAMAPQDKNRGHERLRVDGPGNQPDLGFPMSQAVRAGRFVFLQGANGLGLDGSCFSRPGDLAAQADRAMQNVRLLLEEVGAKMEDVCKVTTYVTNREHRSAIYPVLGRHLRGVNPTSTELVVEGLSHPELDFEMDVFAVIREDSA